MQIDKILKLLIKKHNLNTLELSRRTGIAQPVIYRLMSGETNNPKITTVCTLADYFCISVNQLIGETPLPDFDEDNKTPKHFRAPLLTWDKAANWPNIKKKYETINTILVDLAANPNIYALIMEDDSMDPLFPKETILIIDGNKKPKDHSYVIVKQHRQKKAIFRQLLLDDDLQYLRPISPNSEKYKMKLFNKKIDKYCGVLIQAKKNYED